MNQKPPIDSDKFRKVLGHFPTGVTVITAVNEGKPAGFSVGSFASVSLEPPLVLFCAGKDSQTWPDIQKAGDFCVNVLSQAQSDISNVFASKDIDKFENISWGTHSTGAPVLEGALCWIDCTIQAVHEAGDHWIVIGEVQDLGVSESGESGPLLFFKGGYGKFQNN